MPHVNNTEQLNIQPFYTELQQTYIESLQQFFFRHIRWAGIPRHRDDSRSHKLDSLTASN